MDHFVFISLMLCIFIAGCSKEDKIVPASAPSTPSTVISPADFTRDFADALRKSTGFTVEIVADLELKVSQPDGGTFQHFLDNAYDDYKLDSSQKTEIIRRYGNAAASVAHANSMLDVARIVPVVKDSGWLSETNRALKARGVEKPLDVAFESINESLTILYAEDSDKGIRYLSSKELDAAGIPANHRRSIACANLKKLLPKIESRGDQGVAMLTAGGNYEASLILLDRIWDEKQIPVKGDYVMAVPNRDMLLVTGADDASGITQLRELAEKSFKEGSYMLTPQLFIRRDGKWVGFPPAK